MTVVIMRLKKLVAKIMILAVLQEIRENIKPWCHLGS